MTALPITRASQQQWGYKLYDPQRNLLDLRRVSLKGRASDQISNRNYEQLVRVIEGAVRLFARQVQQHLSRTLD